jgi:ketosteroid isomerase-like protein
MSNRQLLSLILTALLPVSAFAQTTPTPAPGSTLPAAAPAPDAAELTKLLHDFLAGASKDDAAMHDRFWAEDLIYTGSSGRRIGKADIMRDVRKEAEAAEKPEDNAETAIYTAEDIRIQQYGTTAIVAFRLVGTTKKGDAAEVTNYLNSGTFLKRDGKWEVVNWQATKMPTEGDAKK